MDNKKIEKEKKKEVENPLNFELGTRAIDKLETKKTNNNN